MNKPVGVETSNVPSVPVRQNASVPKKKADTSILAHRHTGTLTRTVRDLLPKELQGAIYPVGRLDKDSEGLLLLTNDGVLAYRLTHPKFDHEKEYEVELKEKIFDGALDKLEKGVMIDGTKTKPARITRIGPHNFRIALTEGRNRQIRRMCQKVGSEVVSLKRIRIMTLEDKKLKAGEGRMLSPEEVWRLRDEVGLESHT